MLTLVVRVEPKSQTKTKYLKYEDLEMPYPPCLLSRQNNLNQPIYLEPGDKTGPNFL